MYFIKTENQVKIAIEDINPEGNKTVFFIHGWPLNRKIFEYQFNVLVPHGFRVIAMDIRGFGDSDCTAGGYDYDSLANDVYDVIRTLNARNVTLTGFSMGGAIAVRYLSRFKGHGIQKLALLAAAAPSFTKRPDYPYGMTPQAVNALIERAYVDRPQMVADFGQKLFARPQSENLKTWFKEIGWSASGLGTIHTAESLRDEDLRGDLKMINVPTGIFHGKKDQICPYEFALVQHQSIRNSQLFPYEESGHAVFYEELALFNKQFFDFISL